MKATSRRAGFIDVPASVRSDGGSGYYPAGQGTAALILRRDLV